MISTLLAAAMSVTSIIVPVNGSANEVTAAKDVREDISMILRYDEPASDWESEALPIGNGNIGAMIFGGVPTIVMIPPRPQANAKGIN